MAAPLFYGKTPQDVVDPAAGGIYSTAEDQVKFSQNRFGAVKDDDFRRSKNSEKQKKSRNRGFFLLTR
ncbi:hypothetical protein [Paenibacillus amylolyticus]|uniref:hypothetical protein n=1 Tax=Paenibacillus amylolyticus TaxID=1451 RepID=UPI003D988384